MVKNIIYCILCKPNNKKYIGKDSRYPKRINDHKIRLRGRYHINKYLQRSWNNYGENNFEFQILEEVEDNKNVYNREKYWIEYYRTLNKELGYNLTLGKGSLGFTKSEETKKKISDSLKGKRIPIEPIEKGAKKRWKKLYQYDLNKNLIREYNSLKECAKLNNYKSCTISQVCSGRIKTAYGFIFTLNKFNTEK